MASPSSLARLSEHLILAKDASSLDRHTIAYLQGSVFCSAYLLGKPRGSNAWLNNAIAQAVDADPPRTRYTAFAVVDGLDAAAIGNVEDRLHAAGYETSRHNVALFGGLSFWPGNMVKKNQ